jgi:Phage integrase family
MEKFKNHAEAWLGERCPPPADDSVEVRAASEDPPPPAFGDQGLGAITRSQVQSWVAAMVPGAAPSRAPEDINRLADAIDRRYRALVLVAAYSGCRWGELAYLKTDAVNVLAGTLQIRGSLAEVGGRLIPQGTKTGRWRRVTLPRSVAQVLGEHLGRYPSNDGYVFAAPKGGPLRRRSWYKRFWRPAVERAGLTPALRIHDLRHTHAGLLILNRMPVKLIADRLGHGQADARPRGVRCPTIEVAGGTARRYPDRSDRGTGPWKADPSRSPARYSAPSRT